MPKKIVVSHPEGHEFAGQPTGEIKFVFEDSTEQSVNVKELPENIQFRLAIHGASQKGGDSYAGAKAESDPLAFAKAAVADVIKQLKEGNWRTTSVGGPRVTDLATVFASLNGFTLEQAVEFVDGLDEKQEKELRNKPKVKAALLALTAKRAAEKAAAAAKAAEAEGADTATA